MQTLNQFVHNQEVSKQKWKAALKPFFTDDFGRKCSELRLMPYSGGGNILVGRASYEREIQYRKEEIAKGRAFNLPTWDSLKIYGKTIRKPLALACG